MRFLSLFAGIGGFDKGLELSNHECIGQVELEPFCQRVLERRWPHVTRWPDVREWKSNGDESFTLLVGGFPCQGASVAGKRLGLIDDRTALFWEIIRIAQETKPTWGLFENVPGLFSVNGGRDFHTVIYALRQCWPCVGWRVLDSQYFHVPQQRERIYFVCGPSESRVSEILFEPTSRSGHLTPSREAGEKVAASLRSRTQRPGVNMAGRGGEDDVNLVVARSLANGSVSSGYRYDPNGEEFVVTHPLTRSPYADNEAQHKKLVIAAALNSGGNSGGFRTEPGEHLVTGAYTGGGARGVTAAEAASNQLVTHTLTGEGHDASEDGTGRGTPLVFQPKASITQSMNLTPIAPTMGTTKELAVTSPQNPPHFTNGVRRLTPLECERLQAFPDGWTCLCQPLEAYMEDPDVAHLKCKCPDSPRYRALGNAVTVSVIEWIGRRLYEQ